MWSCVYKSQYNKFNFYVNLNVYFHIDSYVCHWIYNTCFIINAKFAWDNTLHFLSKLHVMRCSITTCAKPSMWILVITLSMWGTLMICIYGGRNGYGYITARHLLINKRRQQDNLIFIMEIPILIRWHHYNERVQCGELNFWRTHMKTDVSYMFYTMSHSPRPIF